MTRKLGRTGLHVPVIGFGGARIGIGSPQDLVLGRGAPRWDEALRIVRAAYDLGIRYFDTSRGYADSDEKIGAALKPVRDDVVIATKCQVRFKSQAERLLRHSFRNLQTDVLDIVQLHGYDDPKALETAMSSRGALQALKEARSKGTVRFIGVTGHNPRTLTKAVKTGEFDTVLVPLNYIEREAIEELLPTAKEMDVGVVIMKAFIITPDQVYNFANGPRYLQRLYGKEDDNIPERVLRYVLGHDISVVIPGFISVPEIEFAVKVAERFHGLTDEERETFRFMRLPKEPFCRECGLCQPCPEFIPIPTVLRYYKFQSAYGLSEYAQEHYRALSTRANVCTQCGECEPRCPYKLPIIQMLHEADEAMREKHP
ncbi:MAG: aldo/keto reductase [Candidatus Bathyarchaeia archaeon]